MNVEVKVNSEQQWRQSKFLCYILSQRRVPNGKLAKVKVKINFLNKKTIRIWSSKWHTLKQFDREKDRSLVRNYKHDHCWFIQSAN